MGRSPCCDKDNVKRGPWSLEEDAMLKSYVETHGSGGNWISLPRKAGLRRCGKSCRLRWLNYLRPDIKHGGFTKEEDNIICTLYAQMGSRWSVIASNLPGRTDNDVKNYWNTKLKKKILAGEINLKALKENGTFLPSTTPPLIQDAITQNSDYPVSQIQNPPPLPSVLQIDNNNGYANFGFNMIHEQNIGFDLMDVVSGIGSSSRNNNPVVSSLPQEGSSNIPDSSLPPEHEGDVEMMDFGFGYPYDPENFHDGGGEFIPSNYYYSEWADLSNPDIKPH